MTPRTYTNLRVNPNNEAEVLGQYVGTDGEVSEQLYLVATMSGNPTGRRHAAKQLAASEALVLALKLTCEVLRAKGETGIAEHYETLVASCQ